MLSSTTFYCLTAVLRSIVHSCLQLIYPPLCAVCRNRLNSCEIAVCSHCASSLSSYTPHRVEAAERLYASPIFRYYYSLYTYRIGSPEQRMMQSYKYHSELSIAQFLAERARLTLPLCPQDYDLILAIPLSRNRKIERGYNQALLLATRLAQGWGIEISDEHILRKSDNTSHTTLTGLDRRLESPQLFTPNPHCSLSWRGKRILLVDDVLTTGSTLLSYLNVLEGLEVAYVDVFVPMTST